MGEAISFVLDAVDSLLLEELDGFSVRNQGMFLLTARNKVVLMIEINFILKASDTKKNLSGSEDCFKTFNSGLSKIDGKTCMSQTIFEGL